MFDKEVFIFWLKQQPQRNAPEKSYSEVTVNAIVNLLQNGLQRLGIPGYENVNCFTITDIDEFTQLHKACYAAATEFDKKAGNSDFRNGLDFYLQFLADYAETFKMIRLIIEHYKANFMTTNKMERYKWEAIYWYKQHWNIDAPDFADMLKTAFAKSDNLLDGGRISRPYTQICEFAAADPDGIREAFSVLYNEKQPLSARITYFQEVFQNKLQHIAEQNPGRTKKLSSFQDLHAISVYLSFEYPEKYFIYKASCYKSFAQRVGFKETSVAENASVRKLENLDQLSNFIICIASEQSDLLKLHSARLDSTCYQDEALHLLAQDIVFYGSVYMQDDLRESKEIDLSDISLYATGEEETMDTVTDVGLNTVLYGPPGTGKTYSTVLYVVAIIENKELKTIQSEPYQAVLDRYNEYRAQGLVEFTTFHQSYGYEEFIEGIKPVISESNSNQIQYRVEAGVFKRFCRLASNEGKSFDDAWAALVAAAKKDGGHYTFTRRTGSEFTADLRNDDSFVIKWKGETQTQNVLRKLKTLEQWNRSDYSYRNVLTGGTKWEFDAIQAIIDTLSQKFSLKKPNIAPENQQYVFVIDEINRGNVSKIFGELITLIEEEKRGVSKVTLPYSQESFTVPENVYILGTMNTADRSLALMDTALRRRFDFVEMMPNLELFDGIEIEGISIKKLLKTINDRIEFLYDREHTIGQGYFKALLDKNTQTLDTLRMIFQKKIIPLLQEYFYDNYEKISLVLGDRPDMAERFITVTENPSDLFDDTAELDFDTRRFAINPKIGEFSADRFQAIYDRRA